MPSTKTDVSATETDEWERIQLGIGEQWDFDHNGPLVGNYLGSTTMTVPDTNSDDPDATREVFAHQFAEVHAPDEIAFVWGSAELDKAFDSDLVRIGDKVRISYLGKNEIKGGRTIRRYRVDLAKRT